MKTSSNKALGFLNGKALTSAKMKNRGLAFNIIDLLFQHGTGVMKEQASKSGNVHTIRFYTSKELLLKACANMKENVEDKKAISSIVRTITACLKAGNISAENGQAVCLLAGGNGLEIQSKLALATDKANELLVLKNKLDGKIKAKKAPAKKSTAKKSTKKKAVAA